MHDYDFELISLLQSNLKFVNLNKDQIQKKEIGIQPLIQSSSNSNVALNVDYVQDKFFTHTASYLIPLLSSEYPKRLLAEYRSLDLELQTLKSSIQKSTLDNSTKLIKKNKQVVIEVKKKFIGFEKKTNLGINHALSIIVERSNLNQHIFTQKISQFRKLTTLRKIFKLIVELIELPNLIESFITANMIDDALDTLEYSDSTIKLLKASISYNKIWQNKEFTFISTIIESTKQKINSMKDKLYLSIKSRLIFDQLSLLNTIEIIGHLRSLKSLNNELVTFNHGLIEEIYYQNKTITEANCGLTDYLLAKVFLRARSEYIDVEFRNKSIMLAKLNCCASLKCALTLFNSPLQTVISTFNSLFSNKNEYASLSSIWMNNYMNWFVVFCKKALTLVKNKKLENGGAVSSKRTETCFSQKLLPIKTVYLAQFDLSNIPITYSSCQDLYLQVYNSFSFSKPVLLIIISLLENYMIEYYRKMLEFCIDIFSYELREFNWENEIQASNLIISKIRPLSILDNEFANILNEIKQCPLKSLKSFILDLTDDFLLLILKEMEDFKKSHNSASNLPQYNNTLVNNLDKMISLFNTEMISNITSSVSSIYNH